MASRNSQTRAGLYLSYGAAIILILMPFHALLTTWAGSNFGYLDLWRIWKEILLIVMALPAAWLAWKHQGLRDWLSRAWLPKLMAAYLAGHIIFGLLALRWGDVSGEAMLFSWVVNLRFIGIFLVFAVAATYSTWLSQNWRKLLFLPALVVAVFGLAQKLLLPYDFLRHFGYGDSTIPVYHTIDNDPGLIRIQSTLRGPNPLGAYLLLPLLALLTLIRTRLVWLAVAAGITVLMLSQSRSAWLGLALALAVYWFSGSKSKLNARLVLGAALAAILLASTFYALRSSEAIQETLLHDSAKVSSQKTSNQVRSDAIRSGLSDAFNEPLGRGPGTAGPASYRNTEPARIAENYYLQLAQEVGLLGLGIFVTINALVFKSLWLRRDQLSRILLASLFGITLINLLSHAWTDDTLVYLWWGLAGIALAPTLKHAPHQPASQRSRLHR